MFTAPAPVSRVYVAAAATAAWRAGFTRRNGRAASVSALWRSQHWADSFVKSLPIAWRYRFSANVVKIRFVLHLIDVVSLAFRGPTRGNGRRNERYCSPRLVRLPPALANNAACPALVWRAAAVQGGTIFPARVPYYRAQFAKMIEQMESYVFSAGGEEQREQRRRKTSLQGESVP